LESGQPQVAITLYKERLNRHYLDPLVAQMHAMYYSKTLKPQNLGWKEGCAQRNWNLAGFSPGNDSSGSLQRLLAERTTAPVADK
jgi:hypothetical protein